MLTIIAALAENNAIGFENKLLYYLPADLRRFKELTTGHAIIMGRKTFESLPKGALPNRRNIVLTRNEDAVFPGAERFSCLAAALAACEGEEIYIIGGASVYAEALPLANRLCLTHIAATPDQADVFFPDFDKNDWDVAFSETHEPDEKNAQTYTFTDYVRK